MLPEDFSCDVNSGEITQGDVRYVMLRPDVFMGIGRYLSSMPAFVAAMEESAFQNARDSFDRYKALGMFNGQDALLQSCEIAARLGWGVWRPHEEQQGEIVLHVENSPFAAGAGISDTPVCGSIVGILRAIYMAVHDERVHVVETSCGAQGHDYCSFQVLRE